MNRLTYFAIFVVLFALVKTEKENVGSSVEVVDNINEYLSKNPNTKLVPLRRTRRHFGPVQTRHYTLGYHVAGERIVAQGNNNFNYPSPQNVQQKIWYPTSGVGARVSFVEIWVDQTSNIGNAYIISGGIGQRNINIVVEAKHTTLLRYRAVIYGY